MTQPAPDRVQSCPSEQKPEAARYHRARRLLAVAGYAADLALLVTLLFTGWSAGLRSFAEGTWPGQAGALLLYALLLGLLFKAISLPFDYVGSFWLEHRYGLSRLTLSAWAKDQIKDTALGGALGILVLELLYGTLRRWPQDWWLVAGAVLTGFFVLMAILAPVLILPIFFKLRPITNPRLEDRLRQLSERAGTRVKGIYEWKLGEKTRKANAALVGLGRTRRILLADTLMEGSSEDEIEAVVAHELGHQVHADIWRGLAVQAAATFAGLYAVSVALKHWNARFAFRDPADFANLPLVALVTLAVSLLLLPAVNALSRQSERRADRYALRAIADPSAFLSSLERLAALNLAERRPHPWIEFVFHSHPSLEKRIRLAQELTH